MDFNITYKGNAAKAVNVTVELFDADNQMVAKFSGIKGQMAISNAKFWWPYTMSDTPAYLYKMKVSLDVFYLFGWWKMIAIKLWISIQ